MPLLYAIDAFASEVDPVVIGKLREPIVRPFDQLTQHDIDKQFTEQDEKNQWNQFKVARPDIVLT